MSVEWVEFLPKRQFFTSYTQSSSQALVMDGFEARAIRLKAEFDPAVTTPGDISLDIDIEESNTNEEGAYTVSATRTVTLATTGSPGTLYLPTSQQVQAVAIQGRFVRLSVSATFASGSWFNLEAELQIATRGSR